jgi:hypothetical protein
MRLKTQMRQIDEDFIIDQEERIRAFRAKQWERLEQYNPLFAFVKVQIIAASLALLIIFTISRFL